MSADVAGFETDRGELREQSGRDVPWPSRISRAEPYVQEDQGVTVGFRIHIIDSQENGVSTSDLERLASDILRNEGRTAAEINIVLVSDAYIKELNAKYRHIEAETDVLAFGLTPPDSPEVEGEVYISMERVAENAATYGVTPEEELKRMVAHGVLHLVGYEDQTERQKREMTKREDYYLSREVRNLGS
ncbi:MAG: rRNA maturation RNase YbeY [Calditrichaeota bacterium]|nr:MAG: rRNA maturation RNase YbeY [Calditrichota bacterium]